MSGQNFSAGLRPAVCFGAQKSCFGGSKWCSSDFEGFDQIFMPFLGIFGCFSSIFARYRMSLRRVTGQGSPGAAPRRRNVGNMLDVDRPPKCCVNMFNKLRDPLKPYRQWLEGAHMGVHEGCVGQIGCFACFWREVTVM